MHPGWFIIPFFAQDWWLIKLRLITEYITLKRNTDSTSSAESACGWSEMWGIAVYQRPVDASFVPCSSLKCCFGLCSFTPPWPGCEVTLEPLGFAADPPNLSSLRSCCSYRPQRVPWLEHHLWLKHSGGSMRSPSLIKKRTVCRRREHKAPVKWAKVSCVHSTQALHVLPCSQDLNLSAHWTEHLVLWQWMVEMNNRDLGIARKLIHRIRADTISGKSTPAFV